MNREDITRMAREAGFVGMDGDHGALRRFAALVAAKASAAAKAAEREACAKVCEQEWNDYCAEPSGYALAIKECAAAIRARGETK